MKPDIDAILDGFPRRVPVFPLAGVVLFPGAVLPLHIFEERYREMLKDAMAADRLIGLALLRQCSREEYETEPPFHETVCVSQIIHHEALDDGRSNIAVLGLSAARAVRAKSDRPYRTARLELLDDQLDTTSMDFEKLESVFGRAVPGPSDLDSLRRQLEQFWGEDRIPAALINTCALTAQIYPAHKLELLEERSLTRRLERLVELIRRPWQWN